MPFITQSELPALLRPLIDRRLSGGSDARGQRPYCDIAAAWDAESDEPARGYPDTDIRGLTGAGVERQWDGKGEVIRWEHIRRVTVGEYLRGEDGWLHYHPRATYHVVSSIEPVQVAA
jgi:hypothetical protein